MSFLNYLKHLINIIHKYEYTLGYQKKKHFMNIIREYSVNELEYFTLTLDCNASHKMHCHVLF